MADKNKGNDKNTEKNAPASGGEAVKSRPRVHALDELRGIAIFCMIFFHAFYTIGYFFEYDWGIWLVNFFTPAEPYFAGVFIVLSGIACNLSHSNLERGVKLLLTSLGVTLVTYLTVGEKNMIQFGILHMLSCCMLLYGLSNKYLKLVPSWIGILLNVVLFVLTYQTTHHIFGLPPLFSVTIPDSWYSTHFLFMFGFCRSDFVSTDYFPLLPWLFLFFAGTYLGRIGVKRKFPKWLMTKRLGFFGFMGRHSLLIYLLHQPLIFGICYAVNYFKGLFGG